MKILALSGWGQPHDALAHAFPNATHVDYAAGESFEQAISLLQKHADADVVVGWSMGGQVAARAISEGVLAPKSLLLIATPYQFARTEKLALGIGADTAAQFRENYVRNAGRTFNKAYSLIAHNDARAEDVKKHLTNARERMKSYDWLKWFDALVGHTPIGYNFASFPHTLLVHGTEDVVIAPEQAKAWKNALPSADLHIWEGCGHAPHWHDAPRLRALVEAVS